MISNGQEELHSDNRTGWVIESRYLMFEIVTYMERSKRLGTENPAKLLLMFSIPAIVGLLVQACYNVTNRIFIGNAVDLWA